MFFGRRVGEVLVGWFIVGLRPGGPRDESPASTGPSRKLSESVGHGRRLLVLGFDALSQRGGRQLFQNNDASYGCFRFIIQYTARPILAAKSATAREAMMSIKRMNRSRLALASFEANY